jgi:hypothetical protein
MSLGYVATSAITGRGNKALMVETWVRRNTHPDERVLVSTQFATNLPNRAYTQDMFPREEPAFMEEAARLGIRYVIWDEIEWPGEMREMMERRFTLVQTLDFGAIYRVGDLGAPAVPQR